MSQAGANVVLASRTEEQLAEVLTVIQESGGSAIAVPTDVTDDAALENLVTETTQAFGRIDILVNNAGMNRLLAPTEDIRISGFDKVIDVNLRGPYVLCQLVGRQMIEQGDGGSIINILTTAARLGIPTHGPYSAAKAGLMRFSEALAFEWGQHKVRVNCIGPGAIQTEMSRAAWDGPGKLEAMEELIPVGRIGQPSDIGYATLFLASEAAAYVTAQTLWVDGGSVGRPSLPRSKRDAPRCRGVLDSLANSR